MTVLRDGVTEPPLLQACQEGLKQPGEEELGTHAALGLWGHQPWAVTLGGSRAVATPALGGDIRGSLRLQGLRHLGRVSMLAVL